MDEEPILEHLTTLLKGDDRRPQGFRLNGFRSLEENPPKNHHKSREMASKDWNEVLETDEELEELYAQAQRAHRLYNELKVAELMIKAKMARAEGN
jgi:hypothetical protein